MVKARRLSLENLERLLEISNKVNGAVIISNFEEPDLEADSPILEVEEAYNDSTKMPDCVERSVKRLIYHLSKSDDKSEVELKAIDEEITQLKKSMAREEATRTISPDIIDKVTYHVTIKDWKTASTILRDGILKLLQVLNINELQRLTSVTNESAQLIKDQEIILLLGRTRDGKSTTIHYLAGSKMVKTQKKNGIDTIIATQIKNKYLNSIKISEIAKSETRYISPVLIQFNDTPGMRSKDSSIWICDTPGFDDNNGPEVDISNGIGIYKCISGAATVRPVFLISKSGIEEGNLKAVDQLIHTIIRMSTDSSQVVDKLQYLFSKYDDEKSIKQILPRLQDFKLQQITNNVSKLTDKQREELKALLEHMIEGIEYEGPVIVSPVGGLPPGRLLQKLIQTQPISNPKLLFKQFILQSSMSILKEQVILHKECIRVAVNHNNWELIKYKLDELAYLSELLDDKIVTDAYNKCLEICITYINQKANDSIKVFNKCFINGASLKIQDVSLYLKDYRELCQPEILKGNHLKNLEVLFSNHLIDNIGCQLTQQLLLIQEKRFCDPIYKTVLNNLKCIKDQQPCFAEQYDQLIQQIHSQSKIIIESFTIHTEKYQFEDCLNILNIQHEACSVLDGHPIDAKGIYEASKQKFVNQIEALFEKSQPILKEELFNEKQAGTLSEIADILTKSISGIDFSFRLHGIQGNLIQIRSMFIRAAEDKYLQNVEMLDKIFDTNKPQTLLEVQPYFIQMHYLKNIRGVSIEASYHNTLEKLSGCITVRRLEFENIIRQLEISPTNVDYKQLRMCLESFETCKWLEMFKSGSFATEKANVVQTIINYAQNQSRIAKSIRVDLNTSHNLEKSRELCIQTSKLEVLADIINEVRNLIDDIMNCINNEINKTFEEIKEKYQEKNKNQFDEFINFDQEDIMSAIKYVKECLRLDI